MIGEYNHKHVNAYSFNSLKKTRIKFIKKKTTS
jgi:hypothetical protein